MLRHVRQKKLRTTGTKQLFCYILISEKENPHFKKLMNRVKPNKNQDYVRDKTTYIGRMALSQVYRFILTPFSLSVYLPDSFLHLALPPYIHNSSCFQIPLLFCFHSVLLIPIHTSPKSPFCYCLGLKVGPSLVTVPEMHTQY